MTEFGGVRLLAENPEIIPTLADWYKNEWPDWFADTPLAEIESDFRDVANRDQLPLALAAFDNATRLLGVCSIRDHPFEAYPHGGPWLRGLYVHHPYRGQGVAEKLIRAACEHAARLQIAKRDCKSPNFTPRPTPQSAPLSALTGWDLIKCSMRGRR